MVPPRPVNRRLERSLSPNHGRFAPSPLNESPLLPKSPRSARFGTNGNGHNGDHHDRPTPVEIPSTAGQEGLEYASLAENLNAAIEQQTNAAEHTRTVGEDLKLHAPKPSLPAASAKQRVMAVTRTDSDRAASFGIGRPSSNEDSTQALPSNRSLKKKASTTSQLSNTESNIDDEHGIPEIGQQVPMYPNAGDVQAPSPAPSATPAEGAKGRHHSRKNSSRGNLPPGSYGLHGHGVVPQDKLEKAYYEKHPDLLKKEIVSHHHDRPNDFSMSSDDLNKIVRDTASRGSGLAVKNYAATPTDQVAWQALEESTSRVASPRPSSAEFKAPAKPTFTISDVDKEAAGIIHVDEPGRRRSVMFSESESPGSEDGEDRPYKAPILADDEVAKDPSPYDHQPAVEPGPERRGSAFEIEEPTSRPSSRPASLYKEASFELRSTPLEDVEEYEPLFEEDDKDNAKAKKPTAEEKIKSEHKRRFPSADIWEDAPSSVHFTAEVSTPEPGDEQPKATTATGPAPRDGETPAQAFARHQEELAEKEVRERGPEGFLPGRKNEKPTWVQHQPHLATEAPQTRPSMAQRFPSRDVWEDTPDSLKLETEVETPQQDDVQESPVETSKPEIPLRPRGKSDAAEKPAIPERPRPRQSSGDDKPAIPDRPKPQVPARPAKAGPTSGGLEPAEAAAPSKPKPAVPARPMGSKIAALRAGLNLDQRLRLGPQAPKKEEEPIADAPVAEEKEKAPLVDARKGRARGPQRRAPAKSASPAPAAATAEVKTEDAKPTFVLSKSITVFELDPDEGVVSVGSKGSGDAEVAKEAEADKTVESEEPEPEPAVEVESQAVEETKKEAPEEPAQEEETHSLVTNMAGETILQDEVQKSGKHLAVEPRHADE